MKWPYSHPDGIPFWDALPDRAHTDTELQLNGLWMFLVVIFIFLFNPFFHINDNLQDFSLSVIPSLIINIIALIIPWTVLALVIYYLLIYPFLDKSSLCNEGYQSLILERFSNGSYKASKEENLTTALDINYDSQTDNFIFDKPEEADVFNDRNYIPLQFIKDDNNNYNVFNTEGNSIGTIIFENNTYTINYNGVNYTLSNLIDDKIQVLNPNKDLTGEIVVNYTTFKQEATILLCLKEDINPELKEIILGSIIVFDQKEVKAEQDKLI